MTKHPGSVTQAEAGTSVIAIPLSLTLARLLLGPVALWMASAGAPRAGFAAVLARQRRGRLKTPRAAS